VDLNDIEETLAIESAEVVEGGDTLRPDRTAPAQGGPVQDLRRIGRYPVLGKLGEGGMGAVYAAYDEELDRRIAIKLLIRSGGPKDERNRARVRREAQAMARLSHPAVAHVYEVGEFEGLTYIAMEYVRGTTLKGWLDERRPLAERLEVLIQAGRGLVAAHRAGVVHRDFKPDNVMVDRHRRARVLDFGLAQAHDDASVDRTEETFGAPGFDSLDQQNPDLTRAGTVMGTPSYMSPEQHLGAPTSTSTDQYSFCAVAYELLYGVRPYTGPNRLAIAYAIHRGEMNPPPPDSKVSPAVHQVVMRGLAKDPSARWPSMEALVDALEAAMGTKRRPWLLPALGGVAVVIIAVLAVLLLVRPEPGPAELSRVEALAQSAISAGAQARWVYPEPQAPTDTALVWVHELVALAEGDDEDPALAEGAAARAATLRADFGAALVRLGDYYWEREGGQVFARDFYLQAVLFDGSLGHARERSGFTNGELADMRARALAGKLTGAEIDAGRDLAALAAAVPEDEAAPVDEAVVEAELAKVTVRRRAVRDEELGVEPAEPRAKVEPEPEPEVEPEPVIEPELAPEVEAEPVVDEAGREAARKEAAALVAEGDRLRAAGRTAAAEGKYFAALRVNGRNAQAHDGLRRLKFDAGRYAEAVPHAEKAARHAPGSARYRRTLGDVYFKVGQLEDAEAAYAKAVALGDAKAQDRLALVRKKLGR
jgi:tetratricopeptide (TPR) repeat protein/predicted Ser/Thr protein kinase